MNLFKNLGYDYIVNIKSILWLLVSLDGLQFSSCFGTEHETVLLLFPQEYLNQGCGSGFRFIGSESTLQKKIRSVIDPYKTDPTLKKITNQNVGFTLTENPDPVP